MLLDFAPFSEKLLTNMFTTDTLHCAPYWPQMSAKRARSLQEQHDFFWGCLKKAALEFWFRTFSGRSFKATARTSSPIPQSQAPIFHRPVIWTSCRLGVNVNDDTEAFAPIKLCFINARIYGEWQRQWQHHIGSSYGAMICYNSQVIWTFSRFLWSMAGNLRLFDGGWLFPGFRAKCLIIFYLSANWYEVPGGKKKTKKIN